MWADAGEVRGEIVIVTAGRTAEPDTDVAGQVQDVETLVASGTRLKDAVATVATVAAARGAHKKELYNAVLEARKGQPE